MSLFLIIDEYNNVTYKKEVDEQDTESANDGDIILIEIGDQAPKQYDDETWSPVEEHAEDPDAYDEEDDEEEEDGYDDED